MPKMLEYQKKKKTNKTNKQTKKSTVIAIKVQSTEADC